MRARKTDRTQPECIRAVRLLGLPYRLMWSESGGVGDILVLMPGRSEMIGYTWFHEPPYFLELECKVPSRKDGGVKASKFTSAQKKWREQTKGAPRETVTGFEDTLTKLRARMS